MKTVWWISLLAFCQVTRLAMLNNSSVAISCSVFTAINGMPAWTPSISSELLPQYAIAIMRSNRWPGAFAFAQGRSVSTQKDCQRSKTGSQLTKFQNSGNKNFIIDAEPDKTQTCNIVLVFIRTFVNFRSGKGFFPRTIGPLLS